MASEACQLLLSSDFALCPLLCTPLSRAQGTSSPDSKGVDSGGYNIQQTVEAGYRATWINGNQNTYNTFVNLASGVRLFNYTLEMRSIDHQLARSSTISASAISAMEAIPNDVSRTPHRQK